MQEDLFQFVDETPKTFKELVEQIEVVANRIVAELEYPDGALFISENVTKTETNYPVLIREVRRTAVDTDAQASTKGDMRSVYVCTPIITIAQTKEKSKLSGCVVLRIGARLFDASKIPHSEEVKERWVWVDDASAVIDNLPAANYKVVEKDDGTRSVMRKVLNRFDVYVRLDSAELLPYLEGLMRDRLLRYKSNEPSYACCHLYSECSDARKCVSKDKMYATACMYRKNLERGKIFYGKNQCVGDCK